MGLGNFGLGCQCCNLYDCDPVYPPLFSFEGFTSLASLDPSITPEGLPLPTFSNGMRPTLNGTAQAVNIRGFPIIPESNDFKIDVVMEVTRHLAPAPGLQDVRHGVSFRFAASDLTAIPPTFGSPVFTVVRSLSTAGLNSNTEIFDLGPGGLNRQNQLNNYFKTVTYRQYDNGSSIVQAWYEDGVLITSANRNKGTNPTGYRCVRQIIINVSSTAFWNDTPSIIQTVLPVVKSVTITEA